MIKIVPAIDIIDGRCVRLTKGDYGTKKVYDCSPVDMAMRYADSGVTRIHLVDLDGAKASEPRNLGTLEAIASRTGLELEWGGGISGSDALSSVFDAGATNAIIGTLAVREPDLFESWLEKYGASRMMLGADVRDGKVAVKGWLEDSLVTIDALIEKFLPYGLKEVICTDISRDGMLSGPSFDLYGRLMEKFPACIFTVSGGISSMKDIEKLSSMGLPKVIAGKAIYENRITLEEIEKWSRNE